MFYVDEVRNLLRASNFRTPARRAGFENFRLWSIGGSGGLLRHVRSTPGSRHQAEGSACPLGCQKRMTYQTGGHHIANGRCESPVSVRLTVIGGPLRHGFRNTPQRAARPSVSPAELGGVEEISPSFLRLRNRSPGPVHERLHLLQSELTIFVAVNCLENPFVSYLKLLQ